MRPLKTYRRYPNEIKEEIARSGNIYLFPELKIPRTTAQYWTRNEREKRLHTSTEKLDSIYKQHADHLKHELEKERALRRLLETVRRLFPHDFRTRVLKMRSSRAQIITAIKECLNFHKLSTCLQAIGLSKSAYLRWASELSFCKRTQSICDRRKSNELTEDEVRTMKHLVTARKYAHISVASLHLLAQRMGQLFCSIDTWYRYIRRFEWSRPWNKQKFTTRKTGIRALAPNELWHIDVTVVNVRPGYKLYIQVVIDNFSRYALAWRVTESIGASETIETLQAAKKRASELLVEPSDWTSTVMMDPGSENNNHQVSHYILSSALVRALARVEIRYSNSMIESLFRQLKNNYLYHQGIRNIQELERKATYYLNQHNETIPLALHHGGTPSEVYRSKWNEENQKILIKARHEALAQRKLKNRLPSCGVCPA
jgi:transposase InsO family protein